MRFLLFVLIAMFLPLQADAVKFRRHSNTVSVPGSITSGDTPTGMVLGTEPTGSGTLGTAPDPNGGMVITNDPTPMIMTPAPAGATMWPQQEDSYIEDVMNRELCSIGALDKASCSAWSW